jgi:hypothetical protein
LSGSNSAAWHGHCNRFEDALYETVQPWWVQIAEYAKTPVLVRKSTAGIPWDEWMKLYVAPTLRSANLIICFPDAFDVDFAEVDAALALGNARPAKDPRTAIDATTPARIAPRRSILKDGIRRFPISSRRYASHNIA